ncbi:dihydropteroate synthase [Yoonia sp. 2307UL14-13]|uniref:dihydropteroate synthase n=1 Tax=Yoonia sp. 2307UL14-13 TaxID=3126506 RepID=UPI0030954C93
MKDYYQPIPHFNTARPADALPLAGGWCWFDHVIFRDRGGQHRIIDAKDVPDDVLHRLTASRTPIGALSMDRPRIMGILNVTPDSFSDGGQFGDVTQATRHALKMVKNGADIIDIGGESTRPGAEPVPVHDEIARTVPAIKAIVAQSNVMLSVDTRKAAVAQAAVAAGAGLINDVAAMTFDPGMGAMMAQAGLPVCLMHAQGDPATMQADPRYDDVLLDVYDLLDDRIGAAVSAGISRECIIIDPGIGFGKTLQHNLALLRGLPLFHALGCPVLLGASRKRFIGTLGATEQTQDRMAGSVAVALYALRQGVQIVRVHDTFETKQAFDLDWAINRAE